MKYLILSQELMEVWFSEAAWETAFEPAFSLSAFGNLTD
jgi:hypothetical protein